MTSIGISGPVQNVLIEKNSIANTQDGVLIDSEGMGSFVKGWSWPEEVLLRKNKFKNVKKQVKADKEATVVILP